MIFIKPKRQKEIKEMLCDCNGCKDSNVYFVNLQQIGQSLKSDESFIRKVQFFNALGNQERLIIIKILWQKDRCVCELEALLDKSQPSISHHLRELEKIDLIRGWKKGKYTYYNLQKKQLKEYLDLINEEFRK